MYLSYEATGFKWSIAASPRDIIAMGCEGAFRHKNGGSNYGFADTHAKYIGLNAESVLTQANGGWAMKYFAYDL